MAAATPSIRRHFSRLRDPRINRRKRHLLIDLVTIAIDAVICGANNFPQIEAYGKRRRDWLSKFLSLQKYAPIVVWCGRPARMVERGARNGLEVSQRREAASVAGPAISGTGPAQVRAGPWASSAVGSYPVSAAAVAIAACNSCHWRWNKLRPSASQRCTSASTLASVKGCRLARSDSKTLTRMLRLYAPAAVLLVRPALRSKAALRCRRSVALLVGATSGCSTNVNNSSSNSRCISSLTRL